MNITKSSCDYIEGENRHTKQDPCCFTNKNLQKSGEPEKGKGGQLVTATRLYS